MKVYLNNINESWVVDRLKDEWYEYNFDISTRKPKEADIIWILTPWLWKNVRKSTLKKKKVVCSIYHIDFQKFSDKDKKDFLKRESYVDEYHVISEKSKMQLEQLTNKKITSIPFWVNQNLWFPINDKNEIRKKYGLSEENFYIGSFQRDTEGSDLKSPKLIKGPDRFIEIVSLKYSENKNTVVILTGKRRQYIISELEKLNIPYKYFEMVDFNDLNELYNVLDLYIVSSRVEGGPQAIVECGLIKTPIISTDVGVASEILSSESIFNMENFHSAKPNIEYANKKSNLYTVPKGFDKYRNLFREIYES
ncbi:MAG: hypothetical protein CMA27_05355 [Euryarchaeota archaeon]|nr:hypothetical protein [Euryarchaeota archaeon]|tara:strand:- start:10312 stop:11235 length:924 start_codon:yes stop_codon:yes gene_type:complete